MSSRIRAVLFDLGGVITTAPQVAMRKYEQRLGLSRGFFDEVIVSRGQQGAFQKLEMGELTLSQFFPKFDAECNGALAEKGAPSAVVDSKVLFEEMADHTNVVTLMLDAVS
eukprot:Colp12_sorted_trinity150504_noHs@32615